MKRKNKYNIKIIINKYKYKLNININFKDMQLFETNYYLCLPIVGTSLLSGT